MRARSTPTPSGLSAAVHPQRRALGSPLDDDLPAEPEAAFSPAVSVATGFSVALLLGALLVVPLPADAQSIVLYSISRDDDQLRVIDSVDGTTTGTPISITFPGNTVSGGNGLAVDPLTGDLYALVRIEVGFPPDRWLVIIDPTNGDATVVGNCFPSEEVGLFSGLG